MIDILVNIVGQRIVKFLKQSLQVSYVICKFSTTVKSFDKLDFRIAKFQSQLIGEFSTIGLIVAQSIINNFMVMVNDI